MCFTCPCKGGREGKGKGGKGKGGKGKSGKDRGSSGSGDIQFQMLLFSATFDQHTWKFSTTMTSFAPCAHIRQKQSDDGGEDCFLHISKVKNSKKIPVGARIELRYQVSSHKGKPGGTDIRVIDQLDGSSGVDDDDMARDSAHHHPTGSGNDIPHNYLKNK